MIKIKVRSYNSLPPEKAMAFHNVVIFIKSVFNKDKNNYYYNIFLEKAYKNNYYYNIHSEKASSNINALL